MHPVCTFSASSCTHERLFDPHSATLPVDAKISNTAPKNFFFTCNWRTVAYSTKTPVLKACSKASNAHCLQFYFLNFLILFILLRVFLSSRFLSNQDAVKSGEDEKR
jgi:hypothetical protein